MPESHNADDGRRLYRVRDWDAHFENSQSRKVRAAGWVPVPNRHDGKSYRRLMALPNGTAIYGAWILLLQVASKCPNRGVLADEDGPLTAEDLSIKTDCPESLFHEAFDVLSGPAIRWLEQGDSGSADSGQPALTTPPLPDRSECAGSTLPEHSTGAARKKEGKGTEQKAQKEGNAADSFAHGLSSTSGKPDELPPPDGPPGGFHHEAELRFVQEWNALADELPAHLVRHGSAELTKFQRDRLADRWAATWSSDWPAFVAHLRSGRCDKTHLSLKQVVEGDMLDRIVAEAKHPQPQQKRSTHWSSRRSSGSENSSADRWRDFDAIDLERRLSKCREQIQSIEANAAATTEDLQRLTELQATAGELEAEIGRRKDKARERLDRARLFDDDIRVDDLTDVRRRERLFNELVDAGHLQHSDADRLRLHTLAIHVAESESAKNPPALFRSLLKAALAGDGWPGSDAQEDDARDALRKLTVKKPAGQQLAALADTLKAAAPAGVAAND